MKPGTFEQFKSLIHQKSGITLGPQKVSLVSARIAPRIRTLGLNSHEDYYRHIVNDHAGTELVHLLDAMATNVTSFFREPVHFEVLARLVRQWCAETRPRLRVWCAASSTGEEPYSLAMTVLDALGAAHPDFRLLATDLSTRALETARRGVYTSAQLAPVPRTMRDQYFRPTDNTPERHYRVCDALRESITFQRLNLVEPSLHIAEPVDAIFCRNVIFYFDTETRHRLVAEFCRLLRPGAYLFVGHSESLLGLDAPLEVVQPSVYRKLAP
jgi:chemotaxis protein methyltransferase CheR